MPAVGVDIGASTIKLVSLSGSRKKTVLDAFGMAVNSVPNIETENNQERIQIATTIKKLFQDSGVKQKKAVVYVCLRTKILSRMTRQRFQTTKAET